MEKVINIGGRLHNPVVGGAVTGANEIKDDTKGEMQNVINQETDAELLRLDEAKQEKLTFDQTPTEGSTNPVTSGGVYAADAALQQAIEAILLLIPSAASALNQLADKAFVNSSISTATATFRGTYNLVTDLELTVSATHQQIATALASVVSTADNNDYCFVQVPVSDQSQLIRVTERYKFNGTAWSYEYDLNNSGFTAEQWAAINSGITTLLVTKLGALPTAAELATMFEGKQNMLTFDTTPVNGSANPVTSGGLYAKFAAIEAMTPSDADANNKLVAENRLAAYVATVIGALDASYNITSADGHVTFKLTQADGAITSVQILTDDIASASALTTLGGRVSTAEADIDALQDSYAALTQSDVVIVEGALPSSGQQQNIIYRQPDQDHTPPQFYSDYMWNGTTWVLMATYMNAIDQRPKKGSQNLVTSGGVFDNIGALDVSELNATENPHTLATYVDLSAALAAIPSDYQKGGMSIKFVQSSDNKYVQYRLMSDSFNTTPANWQGVDNEPTAGSDNLVKSGGVVDTLGMYSKTKNIYVFNCSLSSDNVIAYNTRRLITSYIYTENNITVTAGSGYLLSVVRIFKQDLRQLDRIDWASSVTLQGRTNSLYVLLVKRSDDAPIDIDEFSTAIQTELTGCVFYNIAECIGISINRGQNKLGLYNKVSRLPLSNSIVSLSGVFSYNTFCISTGFLYTTSNISISATTNFRIRVSIFNKETLEFSGQSDWVTSYTLNASYIRYYIISVKDVGESDISVSDFGNYVSGDFSSCDYYITAEQLNIATENIICLNTDSQKKNARQRLGFGDGVIDEKPRANSNRLVTSNGVFQSLNMFSKTDSLFVTNGILNSNGVFVNSDYRITTGFIRCSSNVTITANSGYQIRYHIFNASLEHVEVGSWASSLTLTASDVRYYVLDIIKTNNEYIKVSEFSSAISADFSGCVFYLNSSMIYPLLGTPNDIYYLTDRYNLNKNLTGLKDMEWEYQNWVFPQAISYNGVRNCLYFTFTNQAGYSGIACYDYETGDVTKTFLKKNIEVDDHNLIAVLMMSNRHLLCAYSGGHNVDTFMYIRNSSAQECIESFDDVIKINCNTVISYAQLFEYNSKIYMFYRLGNVKWAYRISEDFGLTWSNQTVIVTTPQPQYQYYCQFTETTTAGVLRLCCYSNPSEDDTNIRLAFLHLDTMTLYSSDNETVLGTSNVICTNIPVIIPTPTGKKLRLHNAAKTAINDTKVLYCKFSTKSDSDGEYYIYDNGQNVKIVDAGMHLFLKVQLGAAWIGDSQVVVARGENNMDIVEIWDYNNGQCTLNRTITSHSRTTDITQDYRTGRPMVDNHQKSVLYLQGYYEPISFQNFEQDAHIYNLTNNNQQS